MMEVKDYFAREKLIFLFGTPIIIGLGLLFNHYLFFGSLEFFDGFPSHESTALILILFGFGGIFFKMFNYSIPDWLREKNNKKIVGKIINKIIKK